MLSKNAAATSRVENSAQGSSCQLKFVLGGTLRVRACLMIQWYAHLHSVSPSVSHIEIVVFIYYDLYGQLAINMRDSLPLSLSLSRSRDPLHRSEREREREKEREI